MKDLMVFALPNETEQKLKAAKEQISSIRIFCHLQILSLSLI